MIELATLRAKLQDKRLQAFLRVIRAGESHETDDEAYKALYGWRPGNGKTFADFTDHPRIATQTQWGWTSAAGAYQAMCAVPGKVTTDTWGDFVRWCNSNDYLPLFNRADQDLFAAWCIARRGALDDVLAGNLESAIGKCNREWASLPGSPYGQPTKAMGELRDVYLRHCSTIDATPAAQQEQRGFERGKPMLPVLAGLAGEAVISLAKSIWAGFAPLAQDKLEREIGRHTDKPEVAKQVAAAVVGAAMSVTGKTDPIEATVAARTDPQVIAQVQQLSLDELAKLAPLLQQLDEMDRRRLVDEDASRDAASRRAAEGTNDQDVLLTRSIIGIAIGLLLVGAVLIGILAWLGKDVQTLVGFWVTFAGGVGAKFGTRYDHRYGGSRGSEVKTALMDQMSRGR